jgi:hypothetical protein
MPRRGWAGRAKPDAAVHRQPFYIGKEPTKSRNSHLILLFNFSTITPGGSLEKIEQSVYRNISSSLRQFLLDYRDILGDPLPEEYIIPGDIADSLRNVLVSEFRAGVFTTVLNTIIESRLPKWLYCFRWRRRVRFPGQHLFDSCLERPRAFAGEQTSNQLPGTPSQV